MTIPAISTTALPLPLARRGKVRDVYAVDDDRLLVVATDRVSAFDVVMAEPVPHKGAAGGRPNAAASPARSAWREPLIVCSLPAFYFQYRRACRQG